MCEKDRVTTILHRHRLIVVMLIAGMTAACFGGPNPDQEKWLHGSWELTFNPEHDDSDVLIFKDDGTVMVRTADGRNISGKYAVFDKELAVTLVMNNKIIDVKFQISPDQSRLIYENGAYYTKQQSN